MSRPLDDNKDKETILSHSDEFEKQSARQLEESFGETFSAIDQVAEMIRSNLPKVPEQKVNQKEEAPHPEASENQDNSKSSSTKSTAKNTVDLSQIKPEYRNALNDLDTLRALLSAKDSIGDARRKTVIKKEETLAEEENLDDEAFRKDSIPKVDLKLKKNSRFSRTTETRPMLTSKNAKSTGR